MSHSVGTAGGIVPKIPDGASPAPLPASCPACAYLGRRRRRSRAQLPSENSSISRDPGEQPWQGAGITQA